MEDGKDVKIRQQSRRSNTWWMKVPESYKKRKGKREMIKEIILEHIPDLKDTGFWIF